MRIYPKIIARLPLLLILTGCSQSTPSTSGLPETSMQIGTKSYRLEIAADEASRDKGLMERDSMKPDHGMIFVFPDCQQRSFWMHHTRFPLDIIFADDSQKIVSIHTMKAYDETNTPSAGPAQYAIELSAGEAAANGVKPGDKLQLPHAATGK